MTPGPSSQQQRGRPLKWKSKTEQRAAYARIRREQRHQQHQASALHPEHPQASVAQSQFGTLVLTLDTSQQYGLSTIPYETAAPENAFSELSVTLNMNGADEGPVYGVGNENSQTEVDRVDEASADLNNLEIDGGISDQDNIGMDWNDENGMSIK